MMPVIVTRKGKRIYIPIDREIAKRGIRKLIEQNREVFDKLAD